MADRDVLLDNLRAALTGEHSRSAEPTLEERTARWDAECMERFRKIVEEKDAQATYQHGFFTCAYLFGDRLQLDARALLDLLRTAEHQTGWPVWIVFNQPPLAPYPANGLVECHVYEPDKPREPGHSDFWRASPDGKFFLLRGYQEDEPQNHRGVIEPGTVLDDGLPFWRVGECLVHAARMAERAGVAKTTLNMRMMWTGLRARRLSNVFGNWPDPRSGQVSSQDVVQAQLTVDADRIRLQLASLVISLTGPLFEVFNFAVPRRGVVEAALTKMLQRTGGA
jgi:hypothetical protein